MRILLLNQFFWPDESPTSRLLTDVAAELIRNGHDVTAIAGASRYCPSTQDSDLASMSITRVPVFPFRRGRVSRALSYSSYLAGAAFKSIFRRYDVVVTLTTPPGLSFIGELMRVVWGSDHYIWEMDLYPDIAQAVGVIRHPLILSALRAGLYSTRRRATGVIALGGCMAHRLRAGGVSPSRIHVAENWSDSIEPQPWTDMETLRILYSGNLGLAHDIATVQNALLELDRDQRFRFVFVGGGALRRPLEEYCARAGLRSISFAGYVPRAELARNLGACHIALVTQNPATLGMIVPSKLYTNMAAGRPTLFIGPVRSTAAIIIDRHQCGWNIEPGRPSALIELLRDLAKHPERIIRAGECARRAFEEHYTAATGVSRICKVIDRHSARTRTYAEATG